MFESSWSGLPDHIVVSILSHLPLSDRYHTSLVCASWQRCFTSPYIWTRFTFQFYESPHSRFTKCVDNYGQFLKAVIIELDQSSTTNRENACYVIKQLATKEKRRLTHLEIKFMGENPLFYAGTEFISALKELFGPTEEGKNPEIQLKDVNLSGLSVAYDDQILVPLYENHPQLQKLNIRNKSMICKITPVCILRLVQRCRNLTELTLLKSSLSEEVLLALIEDDRARLQKLSLFCRREEKYSTDISTEVWKAVADKLPDLCVSLAFDHTCPLFKVAMIMDPHIPVTTLRLETFTFIFDEVNLAASYYSKTLEKVILQTRNSPQLNRALVNLAEKCDKLKSLHVFCVLEKQTVEKILDLHPGMKESASYTLKYIMEDHPWTPGKDCFS